MSSQFAVCRGVIFDMDGLVVDTEQISYPIWQRVFKENGYPFEYDVYIRTIGCDIKTSESIMKSAYGSDFPYMDLRAKRKQYGEEYVSKHGIPVKDGAVELIEFLSDLQVPYALATSTAFEKMQVTLKIAGITKYFQNIVAGDQVAKGKPDPEIFLKAAKLINTDPKCCVVLEDSLRGLQAAFASEMIPIFVPDVIRPNEETNKLAHATCCNLFEAKELIERMLSY
ncbi:MAG: HAD family phosphatase [Deltaproteobacteria bacterium]|nr:HAD family phosphatase [Deltaproteobacteria bacterium]